jgi:hypothetical protein
MDFNTICHYQKTQNIFYFGLTYKRLGVFAFLILAIIDCLFLMKIQCKKTNAIFSTKWFGISRNNFTMQFCQLGNLITNYNISVNKGVDPIFLSRLNDEDRREYF